VAKLWKSGRGKLGFMLPLLGSWSAEAKSEMGPLRCARTFERVLNGSYVRLDARWTFGTKPPDCSDDAPKKSGPYQELALIGVGADGKVGFWSFTSDGKNSQGTLADATDVHPEAIGFEAQMPAGYARMVYRPDTEGGFFWVVESKTQKGWRRFTEHHYRRVEEAPAAS